MKARKRFDYDGTAEILEKLEVGQTKNIGKVSNITDFKRTMGKRINMDKYFVYTSGGECFVRRRQVSTAEE